MRHLIFQPLTVILIITVTFLSSCKKNDKDQEEEQQNSETNTNEGGGQQENTDMLWTALVDSTAFIADTNAYTFEFDSTLSMHKLSAVNNLNRVMTFYLASLEPGTYDVDFDNCIVTYQIGSTIYDGGFNPEGSLTITAKAGGRISGTFNADLFSFSTGGNISITEGVFNRLPYSE